ncbi:T9SS type A sorting domain-containing protein, partial [candidate division WOR-3 bacterium]|nr:T9SS type A sorting domain-containing protein [candidate division WOR-3 bacterium]
VIMLLCLGFVFVLAQYPDTLWTRIHSISPYGDIDDGRCVRRTNDGGYIIAGACVPNGGVSAADVLLLKTDSLGYIQWVKSFGIEFMDEGLSVEQTFDGGYIIGGRALFITGPNPNNDNQSDIWMIKTDLNGDTVWTKTYGDSGHDYCTSIHQTSDSGYIMAGTMNSGRSYAPTCFLEYTQSTTECAFLTKTDSEGEIIWTKTYQVGSYGNCVQQTTDGGYVLVGMIVSDDQPDIYLVKTDSFGDTLWTETIGSTDSLEFGRAVRQLSDGYIIVGHIGPMPMAGVDGLLVRTDPSGEVVWTNSYGDSLSDVGNSIEVTPDGGFFVVGNTNCMMHVHIGNMWAFKTDAEGNLLWERIYDIALSDFCWSCTETSDGGYVVTGLLGYSLGGDLWLAKIGRESGIEDATQWPVRYPSIRNHPNPFSKSTVISYLISQPGFVSMGIYDMLGRKVHTLVNEFQRADKYSIYFDARTLASGVYFCKLKVGDAAVETHSMLLIR